ncbi:MAG TPA: hypothetical protein DCP92_02485 [Nitrospiraceae bacterium]|nr:hypothetical protein [Nitrospiraceae bacterium]
MERLRWQLLLGALLIVLSVCFYFAEIKIFQSPRDTFFYLVQDIAFVPIQVLLVTLIINRLLGIREKRSRLAKLNMVIGAFFSEVGTKLLTYFSDADPKLGTIREYLIVTNNWPEKEFVMVSKRLKNYICEIDIQKVDLEYLRRFLLERRDFLLQLLENPNLLEHESFTELLLAVFHLAEEMASREYVQGLPEPDLKHLANDIVRAYTFLVTEWLAHMRHLKDNYPYLFSLAMRTNPFDESASPVIQK